MRPITIKVCLWYYLAPIHELIICDLHSTLRSPSQAVACTYRGYSLTKDSDSEGSLYTCTTSVLSAPTADSVTVQADPHYSSPLQQPGSVVL